MPKDDFVRKSHGPMSVRGSTKSLWSKKRMDVVGGRAKMKAGVVIISRMVRVSDVSHYFITTSS